MRAIIFPLLFVAGAATAQPMMDCDQAANGMLAIWPELKAVGGVETGAELRASPEASWQVPSFAFWRAAKEKQMGSQDFVWNTVIIQADSLLQCNIASLPAGQRPPKVEHLDFYNQNRAAVLGALVKR